MKFFQCSIADQVMRIDKALRETNSELKSTREGTSKYYASRAQRRDLLSQLFDAQTAYQSAPVLELTEQQQKALDHRCRVETENHDRMIERLTKQGAHDEARRWRLQSVNIRERLIREMGIGGRDADI